MSTHLLSSAEDISPCQGAAVSTFTESHDPPGPGRLLTFNPEDDTPHSSWHSFPTRPGDGPGLPSIAYSLSTEGLSLTGQQYATSLLNLLHSDRAEMGPSIASSSKPELLSSWTVPAGFRDPVDPAVGFEPGKCSGQYCSPYFLFLLCDCKKSVIVILCGSERHLDKKDLYWYWMLVLKRGLVRQSRPSSGYIRTTENNG